MRNKRHLSSDFLGIKGNAIDIYIYTHNHIYIYIHIDVGYNSCEISTKTIT